MEGIGAYGGGKAGGAFDPVGFIRRPQVLLRALCWVGKFRILIAGGPTSFRNGEKIAV